MSTASLPRRARRPVPPGALLAGLLAAGAGAAASFPHATPHEVHLTADLDGDARADLVVVDRASGIFRAAYQTAPGVFTWAAGRASGVENVTAVNAGRLLDLATDQLAFASPDANRILIVSAPNAAAVGPGIAAHPAGMLPRELAVLDIGGAGATAHEDLFVTTRALAAPNGERLEYVRNNAGSIALLAAQNAPGDVHHLRPVRLRSGGPRYALGVVRSAGADTLQVWDPAAGTFASPAAVGLPAGSADAFDTGRFTAGANHHVLAWRRGAPTLRILPVTGADPNPPAFGAAQVHDLGLPIDTLQVLSTTPARFLVVGASGGVARAYGYDGSAPPVLLSEWTPPAGQEFSGAIASPDGAFHLLRRPAGAAASTHWDRHIPAGNGFAAAGSGALPALNPNGNAANLFLFAREPFVSPNPGLLATLNAADWSSGLNLGGPNVQVTAERLGTSAEGLDNPAARNLGPKPAGAQFGLVNQIRDPISIATFQPAVGSEPAEVRIRPPAGPQPGAITVRIEAADPTHLVSYRIGGGAWTTATGSASFPLYRDAVVDYFARPPAGNAKSRLHHAAYAFPAAPAEQDSDGDGVPDFVEIARGLDPNGGADSDGDGYSDYAELVGGPPQYDPLDVNRPPPGAPLPEERSAFDLAVSPRPFDGTGGAETTPQAGQQVFLHDLPGGLRGRVPTANGVPAALFQPAALFEAAPADLGLGLLAVATDPHFPVVTAGPDPQVGREVLALLAVPGVDRPEVGFVPGPGPLEGQAAAWIAAAQAAAGSVQRPRVNLRVGVRETLTALVLERKLHDILVQRGVPGITASNRLTLFPSRPGDVLRRPVPAEVLDALPALGPGGSPAWNLPAMHAAISNGIPAELATLATEVYRISSRSNNAAPGRYPLPVDTLRLFLETGKLQSNYAAVTALTPFQLALAEADMLALLATIAPRPTNGLDLEVTADSFQPGCTRLVQVGTGTPYNLFAERGVPFKFPDTFDVVPGSRVRVLAFTDFTDPCPGADLQVVHATLTAIPAPSLADLDGDLLPDDWECLFLAGDGDPGGDLDNDGAGNLQEYLDGTDPGDALFVPPQVVDLSPPVILIELLPGDSKKVQWQFPEAYAGRFRFSLFETDEFGEAFEPTGIDAVAQPGGRFELLLPAVQKVRAFYVVVQRLR